MWRGEYLSHLTMAAVHRSWYCTSCKQRPHLQSSSLNFPTQLEGNSLHKHYQYSSRTCGRGVWSSAWRDPTSASNWSKVDTSSHLFERTDSHLSRRRIQLLSWLLSHTLSRCWWCSDLMSLDSMHSHSDHSCKNGIKFNFLRVDQNICLLS